MTRLVYVVFALLQWSITSAAAKSQIHAEMSTEELQRIFHVDSHEEVPEYEVVHIRSVVRRSSEGETRDVHLSAFGNNYQLRLERNDHLIRPGTGVRVWVADSANGSDTSSLHDGISLEELPQEDIGAIYQDVEGEAALLVNHDPEDDALVMDGTIGSDLVIRPVPSKLRKTAGVQLGSGSSDDEMFMDEDDFRTSNIMNAPHNYFPAANDSENLIRRRRSTVDHHSIGAHIIYKRELLPSESDYVFMEPDLPPTRKARSPRNKREAPPTIYPEILVIVDYDGYRLHGGDNTEIKKYFVSFWNGVDLRYKLLKGPKVRISIAGIIISRGRDATPYFEKNRVGRNAIDSTAALTDMGKYLFRERRLPVYDIAVAITKFDMCRRRKSGRCTNGTADLGVLWYQAHCSSINIICYCSSGFSTRLDMCRREFPVDECNRGTAGFAYVGGACVVNKRLEKVNSVAIVEDTGGFSGIIVAAHEVGHLLGSVHDGSPPPSYLGGPGAQRCRWEDGYIMSDLRHTERGFKWSHCSIAQFNHFLNGETASCLYNSPHEEAVLPRLLPGKLLSLDAQCRMDRGTSACFKDERVCAQLFCFDASSGYCVSYRPAAEGSPCGDGQICVNGRCVLENENSIPDYAEDIGFNSFLRRTDALPAATEPRPFFTRPTFPAFDATTSTTTTTTTTTTPRTTTTTATTTLRTTTTTTTTTPRPVTTQQSVPWWHTSTKSTTRFPPWYQWTKRFSPGGLPEKTSTTTPSTTTSTTTTTTTTTVRPLENETPLGKLASLSSGGSDRCEDRITKIAGSMSCQDFLQRYGFQYCKQQYIIKNCCVSQRKYCPN